MRSVLVLLVVVAALLAGGWIGGETLLARGARQAIAADPRLGAERVAELRESGRIGVRIMAPRFDDPAQGVAALGDWLDAWVTPTAPNGLRITAAPGTRLTAAQRSIALGAGGLTAEMRFAPTRNLALGTASLSSDGASLDGAPLIGRLSLNAELGRYGADSPPGTGAAYDIIGSLSQIALGALTNGQIPDMASVKGKGRVWLSAVPVTAATIAAGGTGTGQPRLIGLRSDGVDVTLGDLKARLYGRAVADQSGLAMGEIVIDTPDSERFVSRAVDLGLVPGRAALLANAALKSLSVQPAATPAQTPITRPIVSEIERTANSHERQVQTPSWPAPQAGETRITLVLRDGRLWLGPLPLGPAPRLFPAPVR